jgi:hypothetical protein
VRTWNLTRTLLFLSPPASYHMGIVSCNVPSRVLRPPSTGEFNIAWSLASIHRRGQHYMEPCLHSVLRLHGMLFRLKAKAVSLHTTKALGETKYSSYSFLTSALDAGEWSASRPSRTLAPGKGALVPIVQESGWAPEPVWTQRLEEKSFASAGDRTSTARSSSL